MLVYANHFSFEVNDGPHQAFQLIAKWVGQRAKAYVDPERLSAGIRELHLRDGSTLTSRATVDESGRPLYPYLFCARLSHGDNQVSGRRWTTEIGLRQENQSSNIECSIVLQTDEVSARVNAPIQVTRPKLVQLLVESCHPLGHTAGLSVKRLTLEAAPAFLSEIERQERLHPIVVVSSRYNSSPFVTPERLRSIVVGLADVAEIPPDVDTFELQEIVGRRYIAFGGAINVVFPIRHAGGRPLCDSVLFRPEHLEALHQDERSVEAEVLAAITHRTNLPSSWRHISTEKVNEAILRSKLSRAAAQAKEGTSAVTEIAEYATLLEAADIELRTKEIQLDELQDSLEREHEENRRLEANIASLKHALSGRELSNESDNEEAASALIPLRQSIAALQMGNISLEKTLALIATLYPDRIVALDSAYDSARESDRGGFRHCTKAFNLLSKLASEYWQALTDGKSDQQAKSVFGQSSYAANEASALSNEGKKRRSFRYRDRTFLMEKHLKHGVKDSLAETLRIHFEWISNEKKIVIGHCGPHLDF